MRRNNDRYRDRDTKELVPDDDKDPDFYEYVGFGFVVAGVIVGLCFWELGGGILGGFVGYLVFQVLASFWTIVTTLLNRRRP